MRLEKNTKLDSYEKLDTFLLLYPSGNYNPPSNSVKIEREGPAILVKLHNTAVLAFLPHGEIVFNATDESGYRWTSVMTRRVMNHFLPDELHVSIRKTDDKILLRDSSAKFPHDSAMIVNDGAVFSPSFRYLRWKPALEQVMRNL